MEIFYRCQYEVVSFETECSDCQSLDTIGERKRQNKKVVFKKILIISNIFLYRKMFIAVKIRKEIRKEIRKKYRSEEKWKRRNKSETLSRSDLIKFLGKKQSKKLIGITEYD